MYRRNVKKWQPMPEPITPPGFPTDPLANIEADFDTKRLSVQGILESYHSNYDALSEAIQNAVDAVEDAKLDGLPEPYLIEVTISLAGNWISVLDTGLGMTLDQVKSAFAPQVTYKQQSKRDHKNLYRGYKGVGLTFLAYGTDDITIHSKKQGAPITKARMQYGLSWAMNEVSETALLNIDTSPSPLDSQARGTYVKVQFSQKTHPKSLAKITSHFGAWKTILRTKTAIGQILLDRDSIAPFKVKLTLIASDNSVKSESVEPEFLYPHTVKRPSPPFRFLDLVNYHKVYDEVTKIPADKQRQDGVYLEWDSERIEKELTEEQKKLYADQIKKYTPHAYAFFPYQGSVWSELNKIETDVTTRSYLTPGLIIAVNRQRLSDNLVDIRATRYSGDARNIQVIIHFDGVKPDYGRKTIEIEAEALAKDAADRIVQYLAGSQRELLRPSGEENTPGQREVEKNHGDWIFNVRNQATQSPLHIPPVTYVSTPVTEQDVIGLFHQLCALGVFPGIKIYATSQTKTYDCLIEFDCSPNELGLQYSNEQHPLGLSPYVLGTSKTYSTKPLTLEFKNNLDALIADCESQSPKAFAHIDICVCWGVIGDTFPGHALESIVESRLDDRKFPGVTHLLRRNGDAHVIAVIMLKEVTRLILAGQLTLPVTSPAKP
jgi:hypothetical protein